MGTIMRFSRRRRAFILLEVMVGIVVIGVSMVALLRGFIISLDQLKKIHQNEQAIFLGKSLLDDMMLEPPAEGRYEGTFGDDPRFGEEFEDWRWEMEVEAEEPDYEERPEGTLFQELEQVYYAQLVIYYEEEIGGERVTLEMLDLQTILMEPEVFSEDAIQENQLF